MSIKEECQRILIDWKRKNDKERKEKLNSVLCHNFLFIVTWSRHAEIDVITRKMAQVLPTNNNHFWLEFLAFYWLTNLLIARTTGWMPISYKRGKQYILDISLCTILECKSSLFAQHFGYLCAFNKYRRFKRFGFRL